MRRTALALLLVLAGCNRSGVADVTLDADAAQRNATAAKTLNDLAAANAASRGPPPTVHDAEPINVQSNAVAERDEATTPVEDANVQDTASSSSNDAAESDNEAR